MSFKLIERLKHIDKVQTSDVYIDRFIVSAIKTTTRTKIQIKFGKASKIKSLEKNKIKTLFERTHKIIEQITNSFSHTFALPETYRKLISCDDVDFEELDKALDKLTKSSESIEKKYNDTLYRLKKAKELDQIYPLTKAFIGFLTSRLERLNKTFIYLEQVRKVLRQLPYFKQDYITVAIAGFPNVGKSTLLKKITTADPEIQAYSFTTKGLNLGYYKNLQFVDTPGTLNRLKMNKIEKKADLIIRELADKIIFVVDATLAYGDKNKKLYDNIKKLGKPMLIYVSMTDIVSEEKVKKLFGDDNIITDPKQLLSKL